MTNAHSRAARFVVSALILLVVAVPVMLPCTVAGSAGFVSVEWYPHFVTPYDNVTVTANVTSLVGIDSVSIYYRIGKSGLSFNSTSEYTRAPMIHLYDEIWAYEFDKQLNGTSIYFFISAVESNGAETTWPGNYPDYSNPRAIFVQYPSKPYLADIYIYLNELFLSDLLQQANVTVSLSGYLPSFPEQYYRDLDLRSNGPYGYYFGLFTIFEDANMRFWYTGKSSGLIGLAGSPKQVPYDQYALNFTLTIPYRFENLSYVASTPVAIFTPPSIWNAWSIAKPTRTWYVVGNETRVIVQSVLSRRVPDFYPPLVLMVVAFAVLGLVPLVSKYHWDKRFDLFLNAIILGSSAELSQTLYPASGFLGNNVFLEAFALIMISAVLMMAVSSLPSSAREKSFLGFQLEFFTTVFIVLAASLIIFLDTNIPWIAKILILIAGCSGSTLMVLCIYLPRIFNGLRSKFTIEQSAKLVSAYSD